ncbi:peptide-methionine (S)-S-oxide reductase MsrA [Marinomonas mediterranea]|jgi:methionine-S-sulfoxide reductase|uniref:Peptide methionine sulfoxide reductase MsrA n=1 Tax=Marinomonas mediterranea (strain ATCC 700492 / JCM 21426 / NBRC 103028 / MMB-1) TaxID=717774 RepID=F2JVR8_MARM1|nr:peptide-methionine (S)-S-oxide reductase MsrA [Marinomonas mediterranea]ADZ91704.1 Peptide methionine sulfoxide reductase msrA [Marinomonas mediterranea MMB-1]WCN13743.1 peptide-methionine (S)-S-oxide reductase MsrA [Marinomonas mediterranea]WCN17798.1 peptide-methionine (S)-S-oxide reductase MsrA [Marinomonas mediterranea MMB-1]
MFFTKDKLKKSTMVSESDALPGRTSEIEISGISAINQEALKRPLHNNEGEIIVGMGCFWGAERKFWNTPGVTVTSVGYAGGYTPNPTYEEVCSGRTGHSEVVRVVFDKNITSLQTVLQVFWESHDPTQGMRQGNDIGSQYRSVIYTSNAEDLNTVNESKLRYQAELDKAGYGPITTEIEMLSTYYYAEEYHQQYLHKNPNGYCGLGGTGVSCPIGIIK